MTRQPLSPDEIDDIVKLLPVHGARYVAEWIGCGVDAVRKYGKRHGIEDWPRPSGYRRPSLAAQDVPGVSKVCTACGESKPFDEYHRLNIGRFGRRSRCKACSRERRR